MQFIDPYPVVCERCDYKAGYPVDDLLKYKAVCGQCGTDLVETSNSMHRTLKEHRIETWPMYFMLEGMEKFDIDLEDVSDEEYDEVQDMSEFLLLVEKYGKPCENFKSEVLKMDAFKGVPEDARSSLYGLNFDEIARIVHG